MVSPTNKIKVPIRADAGINLLCFGPTNFLAIWGATNPKNPILPATDVATPDKITAYINNFLLSFYTSIPRPVDTSSPKFRASKYLDL